MLNIAPMLIWRQLLCPPRNIGKGDRHEVPHINANIHGIARSAPVVVNVAKKLQRTSPSVVPCNHWIMTQRVELVLQAVTQFSEVRDGIPG
ncbi:hypothetical protein [uncultured Tateyamaria sp.]|uniref:hypothetical protein n=1 Tax=uncultured Tateyamaria sp. TaxID=455651 RepID=UPI002630CAE8|nr:hypothetical protein [uncultured Tateyamaria sp.]